MFGRAQADVGRMESAAASHLTAPSPGTGRLAPDAGREDGLVGALSELEESTARIVSLRQKVERLAGEVARRRESILALEEELASARASAEHDRAAISRLEHELDGHTGLIDRLHTELTSLAGDLATPGAS